MTHPSCIYVKQLAPREILSGYKVFEKGFVKEVVLGVEMLGVGKFVEYREVRCLQGYEKLSLRKRSLEDSRYCGEVCGVSGVLVFGVV